MIADVRRVRPVTAVWITDGGRSASPVRRENESRSVMTMIGVPEANLHFLRFTDQRSFTSLRAIHKQLLPIAQSNAFSEIVSPAYEGGNIDHDVAAFLAARITGPGQIHMEYPLYNRYQGHRRVGVFLPGWQIEEQYFNMNDETRALVRAAIKQYRSERVSLWLMEFVARKNGLLDRGVPYRVAPAYDFLQRPTSEPCDYERSLTHHARFSDWKKSVEEFGRSSD